jgi:multiple sugar transport system ATP-binding protein
MGSPLELYYRPKNVFVATFIGSPAMNIISGKWNQGVFRSKSGMEFKISEDLFAKNAKTGDRRLLWGIRPESLKVCAQGSEDFMGEVVVSELLGANTSVVLDILGHEVQVTVPEPHRPLRGDHLPLAYHDENFYLFDGETEQSILQLEPGK